MKTYVVYFGILAGLITSCEKEPMPVLPERSEKPVEKFVKAFTEYESEIVLGIVGHRFCGRTSISQVFRFRMIPGEFSDGQYFYKIQKHSEYKYDYNPHSIDWTETEGYYRYDFENKKALHYDNLTDTDPLLLMDFSLETGESFVLDYASGEPITFEVSAAETITLDGISFPVLKGHVLTGNMYYMVENDIYLAPFYPNPVWIDNNFDFYLDHDWTADNFSEPGVFYHAHDFQYTLYNPATSTIFSSVKFSYAD